MNTKVRSSKVTRRRLEELAAESKRARRSYDLYRTKSNASGATSPERLRDLKRDCESAQMRLIRARADA